MNSIIENSDQIHDIAVLDSIPINADRMTTASHAVAETQAAADITAASGIDQAIESFVGPIAQAFSNVVFFELSIGGVGIPLIVVWLMAAAVFLTVYLRFQPIRGLKYSIGIIRGRFTRKTDPGQVSSFQALATELSGTVGLGNIAGVAVAITVGGPGAALWIIIFGFFAMTVKMAEATLGVKYRKIQADGTVSGGPMYYLRDGLAEIGRPKLGKFLAVFYAIATVIGVIGAGNLFQANQAAAILVKATGGDSSFLADKLWLIGAVVAALTALVILGGIKKIGQWTSKLTPMMAILYFLSILVILVMNIGEIPHAFALMFTGAFTPDGLTGGVIGVAIVGIQRALFSNAAGIGSAAMAHAASKTTKPATEGFVAMWEPLIDSVIICTLTSLAIITTGLYGSSSEDGIGLTSEAFATVAGWFPILLTICVVLFAFSTILAYGYYGQQALGYLTGNSKKADKAYQIFWILAVIVGASMSLESVIAFSDAIFFLMAFPNLLGLYFLSRILRLEILRLRKRIDVGVMREITPAELQVGMGDHEPTAEQIKAAEAGRRRKRDKLRGVRDSLKAKKLERAKRGD
ncbi:alanine/glycine:cation symporter family protein [Brevibacterium aurantiacum]|nr:alanine/glycine:cation symporter family protein [Brevibacterium aurantiacum]AZL07863.1 alanine:cation symporter family protein [Brevibacterium aurantiacum]PCC54274.1 amino acid transporter [Brevibacterium aurantiacum]RCS94323.1 alanine:cation symporter family protein [Brevibacterium aurantiacum]